MSELRRPIGPRSPSGKALWELLINEFQVPATAQEVTVKLTLKDIRVLVEYWPQDFREQ